MKEVSAGGVVYRKEGSHIEILLIQDRFGKTTLPKGKMEPGETIEQTAIREIKEETGMDGVLEKPLEVVQYQYEKPGKGTVTKEVHYFLVKAEGGTLQAQLEEIDGVNWFPPVQAWDKQLALGYDNNHLVLQKALICLGVELDYPKQQLARMIDHTFLKQDAQPSHITALCKEAIVHQFYSVCVNGFWVAHCKEQLQDQKVKISAVCGFPLGAMATKVKAYEAEQAVKDGADEIDMVMAVGPLLAGNVDVVREDIRTVVQAVDGAAIVKVILETGLLNDEQKQMACRISEEAGAHYVKTSTGFGPGGATLHDIRLMRDAVSSSIGVKASGGVRDAITARAMLNAGATRIGTSSGIAILSGESGAKSY